MEFYNLKGVDNMLSNIGTNLTIKQLVTELMNLDILKSDVTIHEGGKVNNKKVGDVKAHDLITRAINGECTDDELKTLHNQESVVNDVLKLITAENANIVNNENKNIINRRLFHRGAPSKISEEVDVKNEAENLCYSVDKLLKDSGDKISQGEKDSGPSAAYRRT